MNPSVDGSLIIATKFTQRHACHETIRGNSVLLGSGGRQCEMEDRGTEFDLSAGHVLFRDLVLGPEE